MGIQQDEEAVQIPRPDQVIPGDKVLQLVTFVKEKNFSVLCNSIMSSKFKFSLNQRV